MNAWGFTDVGRVRQSNQDAYHIELMQDGKVALCVVCDGMGGAKAGNVASQTAIDSFVFNIKSMIPDHSEAKQDENILLRAIELANHHVHQKANSDDNYSGMGTTLVATLVQGDSITIINVGDSRAYLINGDGIRRITRDHSLVEDMVQMGEITELEAKEHPSKNLITRAVGTDANVIGDIYTLKRKLGEYILLCTDGLSNIVTEQEILYEVLYGGNHDQCCKRLTEIANARGGYDNITTVLLAL